MTGAKDPLPGSSKCLVHDSWLPITAHPRNTSPSRSLPPSLRPSPGIRAQDAHCPTRHCELQTRSWPPVATAPSPEACILGMGTAISENATLSPWRFSVRPADQIHSPQPTMKNKRSIIRVGLLLALSVFGLLATSCGGPGLQVRETGPRGKALITTDPPIHVNYIR